LPLRATIGSENIQANEFTTETWNLFKKSHQKLNLQMPCCSTLAIPKTSKLGSFFFAHKQRGTCESKPESAEHLFLKSIIAKSAIESGWEVTTEHRGETKSGEKWVADVYCKKGKAQVALEVQLASTTYNELANRTEKYKQSNVRVAWFADELKFKEWKSQSTNILPIFGLSRFSAGELPFIPHFKLPIQMFVKSLLNKQIQWVTEPWEYQLFYFDDICWRCLKPVKQIYGCEIDVYYESAKTVPNASTVLFDFKNIIRNEELKLLGLNTIGEHTKIKGNAPGFPYCNECLHCQAPQSNYYLMSHLKNNDRNIGATTYISTRELY
jgi:Competence protein CoiA-like family